MKITQNCSISDPLKIRILKFIIHFQSVWTVEYLAFEKLILPLIWHRYNELSTPRS
ncbi:unnamed protein product [Acanthoscelides obtectus]|uniref:Uncharacterized protein n=1 Tax=Acanthoscelides obtectus TaxID=200917 RepID=A0A9P0L1V8_ACAOB|nr:unnamed protein product [Acanthoscelides obtectus]CAK1646048.1 hypothetical protein AOBTE_LOCUS14414 [Acanthoscelides obtectus]